MEIISKKKNKDNTTEYLFGDEKMMIEKAKKIGTSTGYMIRPKINPNLKIRAMTDTEKRMSEMNSEYPKNKKGNLTVKSKLKYGINAIKTIGKRIIGKD